MCQNSVRCKYLSELSQKRFGNASEKYQVHLNYAQNKVCRYPYFLSSQTTEDTLQYSFGGKGVRSMAARSKTAESSAAVCPLSSFYVRKTGEREREWKESGRDEQPFHFFPHLCHFSLHEMMKVESQCKRRKSDLVFLLRDKMNCTVGFVS